MSTNWPPSDWIRLDRIVGNGAGIIGRLNAGGTQWPVTMEPEAPLTGSSWLTSALTALVETPRDEFARHANVGWAARVALRGIDAALPMARWLGLHRAVIVNNTLFSVSLVGSGSIPGLLAAVGEAARRWPDRMILARGVMAPADSLRLAVAPCGGHIIPHRISYVFDLRDGQTPRKVNFERDLAFLRKQGLFQVPHEAFTPRFLAEAHWQYRNLYVIRHGAGNPDFDPEFFVRAHRDNAVEFIGLADEAGLASFAALRDHGEFLSVPLLGYRSTDARQVGHYRMIFAHILELIAKRRRSVNFGAGAGQFKRLRGGVAAIENMVLVPPGRTALGLSVRAALAAAEHRLDRWIPKAILAHGG